MRHTTRRIAILAALATAIVAGCTYYETAPGVYQSTPPNKFDRAWSAMLGAFDDQGVQVIAQDRDAGVIHGTRDGINLAASLRTQADGSVRVQLDASGNTNRDPTLIDRVSRAYDRFMGR